VLNFNILRFWIIKNSNYSILLSRRTFFKTFPNLMEINTKLLKIRKMIKGNHWSTKGDHRITKTNYNLA